jgi:site-specific DNA-methyltransferase (adenine-specific)
MKECANNAFDLAIVDPPYGIGKFTCDKHTDPKLGRVKNNKSYGDDYTWNEEIPEQIYFDELERISKKHIIWGANYYNCFKGGAIVWYKGDMTKTISHCEIASVSGQVKVDYVNIGWQSGFYRKIKEGEQIHPCQKPVALYKWLLKNYAEPGQRIIDTHLGSGSSAIAAHYFGCDFTGLEIDKDYFEAAQKRFAHETRQIAMF